MNINELIEQRVNLQTQIDELNAQLKELNRQKEANEILLFDEMGKQGVTRTANAMASVSINETVKPEIESYDEYIAYVQETGDFSLFTTALKQAPFQELLTAGIQVPGLKPRTYRRLNMRKL